MSNRVGTVRAAFGDVVAIALRSQSNAALAAQTQTCLSLEETTWCDCGGRYPVANEVRYVGLCPIHQGHPIDRSLSGTTVKAIIKSAARKAGFAPDEVHTFSGHSTRVGAAQELLRRGFDTAAIMRAGGGKSVNVLARYLEHAEHNV
ncbi:tyrosine-type recombinase/integrase [Aestuariicoccus sp. MJ-SS9]|uniref:tyrosine-type recombinase/integrase n=1 Tax=Aestuariicoccus sp. MJ-SS9 TaxID=3079855 RepID=UPI002914D7B0|nr:tyrosine-type recombinase/integrase [Aestuariicoccus sp. MJ-SS9]MDU8913393.1 tyrosine-type recombinase/integrase [Aestuariicoccus sp. MJ-SS9]